MNQIRSWLISSCSWSLAWVICARGVLEKKVYRSVCDLIDLFELDTCLTCTKAGLLVALQEDAFVSGFKHSAFLLVCRSGSDEDLSVISYQYRCLQLFQLHRCPNLRNLTSFVGWLIPGISIGLDSPTVINEWPMTSGYNLPEGTSSVDWLRDPMYLICLHPINFLRIGSRVGKLWFVVDLRCHTKASSPPVSYFPVNLAVLWLAGTLFSGCVSLVCVHSLQWSFLRCF